MTIDRREGHRDTKKMTIEITNTAESNIHGSGHGYELPESQQSHHSISEPTIKEESDEEDDVEDSQDRFYSQAQVFQFDSQPEEPEETYSAGESNEDQQSIAGGGLSQNEDSSQLNFTSKSFGDFKVKEESSDESPIKREDIVEEDGSTSPSGADAALSEMKEDDMKQVVGSQSTFSQEMLMDEELLKKEEQAKRSLIALATGILDTPDVAVSKNHHRLKNDGNDEPTAFESNSQLQFSQETSLGFSQPDLLMNEDSQASSALVASYKKELSRDASTSRVSISPAAEALLQVAQGTSATQESVDGHDEDARLSLLERSGAIRQVVGSQSMLSQEIAQNYSQNEMVDEQSEVDSSQGYDKPNTPPSSYATEKTTPASAARKWGLVSGTEQNLVEEQRNGPLEPDKESSHNSLEDEEEESMDDIIEEENPHSSGENLSQNLDLSGLSQEMNGLSQDSLRWAEEQTRSQGVPSVTPATSTAHSQEEKTEEEDKESQSQQALAALGFNFLLQAAESVSREETRKSKRKKRKPSKIDDDSSDEEEVKVARKKKVAEKKVKSPVRRITEAPSPKKKKAPSPKRKSDASSTEGETQPKKKRANAAKKPNHDLAQQAAALAQLAIKDEHVGKQLLLSMVMERQPTRTPPSSLPGAGYVLQPSFVWSHYPPLEKILREHMEEYYHLSLQKRQSASQQAFNNRLVDVVRKFAKEKYEWTIMACDKQLRDRIRCYYKTHIQNAKKRLATMLKNPRKVANARHLIEHRDLIEQTLENPKPDPRAVKTAKEASPTVKDQPPTNQFQTHPLAVPSHQTKVPSVEKSSEQKNPPSVQIKSASAVEDSKDAKPKATPKETTPGSMNPNPAPSSTNVNVQAIKEEERTATEATSVAASKVSSTVKAEAG